MKTLCKPSECSGSLSFGEGWGEAPFGLVVYQARVLFNSINNVFRLFEGNCNKVGDDDDNQRNGKPVTNNAIVQSYNVIEVYPNPNTGKAIVNLRDAGITSMRLKMYDVNGRVVFEDNITDTTDKNYELNTDVKSGIYFVEVIDTNTDTYYKQKLVIQK